MKVRHKTRDLGVGEVLDALKGEPPVLQVRWVERPITLSDGTGSHLWGFYPVTELEREQTTRLLTRGPEDA